MGIGAYRHLVTVEHPAVVVDPPTWYCSLQPAAQVSDGLAAFFIRGRFHPGIGLETQITFEGRTFQVQAVQDLDERHREIQVTAVEVVGRGTTPTGAPVFVPPTITVGPVGATIDAGDSVMLTVIAVGAVPLFYQWMKDGADLASEIHQFYETGPLTATATYAVRVSNAYGSVLSDPAIVTVPLPPNYQETVIAAGASAYWPLDDPSGTTARDLMGTYDGTISGGVTLNQPGVAGTTAMLFPADGLGKIVLPSFPALGLPFSFELWATPSTLTSPTNRYWLSRIFSNDVDMHWYVTGGSALYFTYTGAALYQNVLSLALGVWQHYVLTVGSDQVTLFVDGVARASAPLALRADGGIGQGAVGCTREPGAETWGWRGALQDVAIYPRALSPAEIAAHYHLRVPA